MWSPPVLEDCKLDRKSATPLHRQVRDNLEGKINSGVLRPYDRLPPVRQLAKAFGVGPGTIVQALASLTRDGIVTSRQGSGTFVLPIRPAATALCFPFGSRTPEDPYFQMGQQIIDGLRRGYGEDREIHIFGSTHEQSAEDMWKMCRVANADGLVFHSNSPAMRSAMVELSERMPVVALLQAIPREEAGQVDVFLANPRPALGELLKQRIARGRKRFAYLGLSESMAEARPGKDNPYVMMYETLSRAVKAAGLELTERSVDSKVYESWYHGDEVDIPYEPLPDKTTLVTQTPSLARMARTMQPDAELDGISYCTGRYTLRECGPGMTILYMAMERAAEEAAKHLQRRTASGSSGGGKRVLLKPEVFVDYHEEA